MRELIRANLLSDSMRARTLRSTAFAILTFGSQNLFRLVSNLILTRILFPEAFGLMAIVFVIIGAINSFSDLGIKVSIIQDKDGHDPRFLNTAWTLQIVRGALISALIWLGAAPVAAFYEQPDLANILAVAGLAALLQGFNSTKLATAERELQLGRVALLDLTSQIIGLAITILLAFWLQSVWALVIGYILSTIVTMALSHLVLTGHNNSIQFDGKFARRLLNFGVYIFLSSIAGFLISQGDRAILGKVATLEQLALYNIGFILASVPFQLTQALNGRVLFPLYAKLPPRKSEENRQNVAKMRWLISASGFVGLFIFVLVGDPLVKFLYDPRYYGAGEFVALVALALMPTLITSTYSSLPLAAGDSRHFSIVMVSAAIIQSVSMLIGGAVFGIYGVILGFAVAPVLYYPVLQWLVRPYRGVDPWHDAFLFGCFLLILVFAYDRGVLADFLAW